jgi:hypothetical protein
MAEKPVTPRKGITATSAALAASLAGVIVGSLGAGTVGTKLENAGNHPRKAIAVAAASLGKEMSTDEAAYFANLFGDRVFEPRVRAAINIIRQAAENSNTHPAYVVGRVLQGNNWGGPFTHIYQITGNNGVLDKLIEKQRKKRYIASAATELDKQIMVYEALDGNVVQTLNDAKVSKVALRNNLSWPRAWATHFPDQGRPGVSSDIPERVRLPGIQQDPTRMAPKPVKRPAYLPRQGRRGR